MSLRDQPGGVVQRGGPYETAQYEQTGRTLASLLRGRWHGDGVLLGAFASQRDYGRAGAITVFGLDGQWRDDGVTNLEPWAEKQLHRSLLYRHLWRHGRSLSVGYARDRTPAPRVTNQALTVKFQWEA